MNEEVRTPEELLSIMNAAAIGDLCFEHMLGFIRTGMTELEVAGEIDRTLTGLGSEGLAFPTICVSGQRSELPHGEPTGKVIEEGDFVTMDFGAMSGGMCSDMTRTVAMGRVTAFQEWVYRVVLEAQAAALAFSRAGVRCAQVDRAARDVIDKAGFGEWFCHGTGHGVGREVHQAPKMNSESEETLMEDMVVTFEPGVYLPGKFGVRIEDLAIVKKFGIINVVKSRKELIIL